MFMQLMQLTCISKSSSDKSRLVNFGEIDMPTAVLVASGQVDEFVVPAQILCLVNMPGVDGLR